MTPNRPGTPTTTFRLDPDLLAAVKVRAAERGETLTGIVRENLRLYLHETWCEEPGDALANGRCGCCGAPAVGETITDVVRRALRDEVGDTGIRAAVRAFVRAYDSDAPDWFPPEIDALREYVEEET